MDVDFSMLAPSLSFDVPEVEKIAIVGMAVQIGPAASEEEFWQMLCCGQDMIGEFPLERKKEITPFREQLYGEAPYVQRAYLPKISAFDPELFHLTPIEAQMMDPEQRLFLESALSCLQNAGYESSIRGSRTGVYVGHSSPDLRYEQLIDMGMGNTDYAAGVKISGNVESMIAARVSYLMDLQGPAMVVNTACSSALSALHMACSALRAGEIDAAIVGAVKIYLVPSPMGEGMGGIQIASSSARTKSFDAQADGTGGGEGVISLLLRPLSLALADGDNIRAVICGSRLNQDGASMGITAPNPEAQARLLQECWRDSGIAPENISYFEAHGTGTKLGDPIELEAITKAFGDYTGRKQFCAIGSVKSNAGHLDCAAGLAGIAKAVLMLERGKIPPTLHFQVPNEQIDFIHSPVYVCDKLEPWEPPQGRTCAVSSFGISGTNAHVVLEQASAQSRQDVPRQEELLLISAQNEECLLENWRRLRAFAQAQRPSLQALCFAAATGRLHRFCRVALVLHSLEQFLAMEPQLDNSPSAGRYFGICKPAGTLRSIGVCPDLHALGRDYVQGGQFAWTDLYPTGLCRRLPLPTYAFSHRTYWVEHHGLQEKEHKLAPCLDEHIALIDGSSLFRYRLSTARCWELREHTMEGMHILPGTVYVEMLLEAGKQLFGSNPFCLQDVMFLSSYACTSDCQAELQILAKTKEERYHLTICSRKQGETQWKIHAEGTLALCQNSPPVPISPQTLLADAGQPQTVSRQNNGPIKIGPRWLSLDKLWKTEQTVTGHFTLQEQYRSSLGGYEAYPSLLDGAVNAANVLNADIFCLPFSYKQICFFRPLPPAFYSRARAHEENQLQQKLFTYDVTLYTQEGETIAQIEGYTLKKVEQISDVLHRQRYHRLRWVEQPITYHGLPSPKGILLLCLPGQLEYPLLRELVCTEQTQCWQWDGQWPRKDIPGWVEHILFCPAYTKTEVENFDLYHSLYAFLQQVGSLPPDCKLTLLTAQAAPVGATSVLPTHTGLLGMGKSLQLEWPQIRAVDADDSLTVSQLLWELKQENYCTAWHQGRRYVEKMSPYEPAVPPAKPIAEGTYVITGGLGGMGRTFQTFLQEECPKAHIALLQRRLPEEILPERVHAYCVDVGDRAQMEDCFARIKGELPPVRGVIHTAGIAGGQFVAAGSWDAFEAVLRPKLQGAWNLARFTRDCQLDFFVLCSSMSAVFGATGQSDYTTANAFLDGFAHQLYSQGIPAVAIDWSGWREVGMAMAHGVDPDSGPLSFLTPQEGWKTLRYAISARVPQLLSGMVTAPLTARTLDLSAYGKVGKEEPPKAHRQIAIWGKGGAPLTQTERLVAQAWADTLGLQEVQLHEAFFDAGGSSLLISYLFKKLDELFPGVMDITALFVHETVGQIAAYIDSRLTPREEPPAVEPEPFGEDVETLVGQIAHGNFSDEELDALLEKLS